MHMTACTAAAPEKRIHTLEPAADGGCISRETFNTSDNPNKGSRIIPWPPRESRSAMEVSQPDSLRTQILRHRNSVILRRRAQERIRQRTIVMICKRSRKPLA